MDDNGYANRFVGKRHSQQESSAAEMSLFSNLLVLSSVNATHSQWTDCLQRQQHTCVCHSLKSHANACRVYFQQTDVLIKVADKYKS